MVALQTEQKTNRGFINKMFKNLVLAVKVVIFGRVEVFDVKGLAEVVLVAEVDDVTQEVAVFKVNQVWKAADDLNLP